MQANSPAPCACLPNPLLAAVADLAAARGESFDNVLNNLVFGGMCWHYSRERGEGATGRVLGVQFDLDKLAATLDAYESEGGAV